MTSSSSPSVATEAPQDKMWTGDTMAGEGGEGAGEDVITIQYSGKGKDP